MNAVARAYRIRWPDAHHVLVAVRQGFPLVTADQRLVAALQGKPVWVESILDRPPDCDESRRTKGSTIATLGRCRC